MKGLTAIADSEDNIQTVAVKAIKTKLAELKNSNIEAPEPKKIIEVSKNSTNWRIYYLCPSNRSPFFKCSKRQ